MLGKVKSADFWQFVRFCVTGSLNAIIDFGVLNLLLWRYPTTNIWQTLFYNTIAVILAATNSFFWNKYWTFKKREPITRQEVSRFVVIAGSTTLMNDLLIFLLGVMFPVLMRSSLIGSNALKLGAIIGTTSISFFGMRLWVFFMGSRTTQSTLAQMEEAAQPVVAAIATEQQTQPMVSLAVAEGYQKQQ
jgi:putative flippase GtrA